MMFESSELKKVSKSDVKKALKKESLEVGLIASKLNPFGIWCSPVFVVVSNVEELEKYINEYAYYNCTKETGLRVNFYVKVK